MYERFEQCRCSDRKGTDVSTDIQAWIEERRTIHSAATDGPWSYVQDTRLDGLPVYRVGSEQTGEDVLFIPRYRHNEDGVDIADTVTDAHNITVPTALSMIEAVLELHHPEMFEARWDAWEICRECEGADYPCPTVRALEGVIDGE